MSKKIGDIDIDVKSHTDKSQYGVRAVIYDEDKLELRLHPSGYYPEADMPIDGVTGLSALDAKDAEERGFIKIDLLTNTAYDCFNSKEEVLKAISEEPDWDMLLNEKFVKTLPHIANHFELVELVEPRSIIELADVLALIRPGKTHLLDNYMKNPEKTRINLYRKSKKGYMFKKSHAVGYASMIVCIMNKKGARKLLTWS